jgi:hypothetical protein
MIITGAARLKHSSFASVQQQLGSTGKAPDEAHV